MDQGKSGTKPFPDTSWSLLSGSLQNLDEQREVGFAVFPIKRPRLGHSCYAILVNLVNKEAVFWYVIKGSNQHNAAWDGVWFFRD